MADPGPGRAATYAGWFRALADATRVQILNLVAERVTHPAGDNLHAATIRATKSATAGRYGLCG